MRTTDDASNSSPEERARPTLVLVRPPIRYRCWLGRRFGARCHLPRVDRRPRIDRRGLPGRDDPAPSAISPGDVVDSGDLELRSVRLGEVGEHYLTSEALPESGIMVNRAVAEGELVPASAVGSADSSRLASVVVGVDGQLPQSVDSGSVVDLWSAAQVDGGGFGPPAVVVSSATVVRIVEDEGIIARGEASGVEVLVPRARVAMVLEALSNGHSISLVPVSVPLSDAVGR